MDRNMILRCSGCRSFQRPRTCLVESSVSPTSFSYCDLYSPSEVSIKNLNEALLFWNKNNERKMA